MARELKIPVQELLDLFLAVADMCDSTDCETPVSLDVAYEAVLKTAWGQKMYSDAVEVANRKLG